MTADRPFLADPTVLFDRRGIAAHVAARLEAERERLTAEYRRPDRVSACVLEAVLPEPLARAIHAAFPDPASMTLKRSIKERKYVSAQMDAHAAILEEAVFAFQDPRVLGLIQAITGLPALEADPELYAGGISAMPRGGYLKPHLDNSHHNDGERYRALNLLYYVTPGWRDEDGGALELWDEGPRGPARPLAPAFNRLVLMATNRRSWHSVGEITGDAVRCCVSNYYFTRTSPEQADYFHATSFRGRAEEPGADLVMRADAGLRTAILKTLGPKAYRNPHAYRRAPD